MGSYCASREEKQTDQGMSEFQRAEKIMLLHTIPIGQFHRILKEAAKERSISIYDLAHAFKKHKFGQLLLQDGENLAKMLIKHPIFKSRNGEIDWYKLFTIGLLYTKGTDFEKADSLILTYDTNHDGDIFTKSVSIILSILIHVATVIVPAFVRGLPPTEVNEKYEEEIKREVEEARSRIFGDQDIVLTPKLRDIMSDELSYFFCPQELREKMPYSFEEPREKLEGTRDEDQ